MKEKIIEVLKTIYDPEIPINIYDLGLVYDIKIEEKKAHILMTLTAPGCPIYHFIKQEVEKKVKEIEGIDDCQVEFTFNPPWSPDKITEEGKEALRRFGFNI
ncbi:MAG: iron-sulfur cluster assembly protein [candidate division WOR-3 bacterium]